MSEKKQGFFSKLFGKKEKPEVTPQIEEQVEEQIAVESEKAVKPEKDITKPKPKKIAKKKPSVKKKVEKKQPAKKPVKKTIAKPKVKKPKEIIVPEIDDEHLDAGPPETNPEWVEQHQPVEQSQETPKKKSWFQRLSSGLKRSSDNLTNNIGAVFTKNKLDQETLDDLEDILIQADLGVDVATSIIETLAKDKFDKDISVEDVQNILAQEVEKTLTPVAKPLEIDSSKSPFVILMIGVNGSGKTTSIGKLAQKFSDEGKSVMLAAGDTFRAAAIEQLEVWGQRTGAPVISKPAGSDASGLAYEAVQKAKEQNKDILIIDSAGRLQNREELMAELEKIIRVIKKLDPDAPHAVLLTLDATTGQNALNQVKIFGERAGVTGLIMTKLDGTARGGILVAISRAFSLPIHYIGVGENVEDLESFNAKDFAQAIAG